MRYIIILYCIFCLNNHTIYENNAICLQMGFGSKRLKLDRDPTQTPLRPMIQQIKVYVAVGLDGTWMFF